MKNLRDLFEHELKDLYSAEKQMMEAMPKMIEAANDDRLRDAFSNHFEETKQQFERIQKVCDMMNVNPGNTKCDAMEGLIEEAEGMIKEDGNPAVKDAGLIANAQRIEHYEISGYGTAQKYAETLGEKEAAKLLQKTLDEESLANYKLNELATNHINNKAKKAA